MAEIATINTNIWSDPWVAALDHAEYRVWSYLLSNARRSIAGVYQLTVRQIAAEIPKLTTEEIEWTLARFQAEDKIFYQDSWIIMRNHFKNQRLKGDRHWTGVVNVINNAPDWLRERVLDSSDALFIDFHRVSEGYLDTVERYGIHTLSVYPQRKEGKVIEPSLRSGSADGAKGSARTTAKKSKTQPAPRETVPPDEDPLAKWDDQL